MSTAALLAAAAAACAVFGVAEAATAARGRGRSAARIRQPLLRLAGAVGRSLGAPAPPRSLRARVAAAGLSQVTTTADLMAAKVGAAALGVLAGILVAGGGGLRRTLVATAALGAAGFIAPDRWLARRARARAHRAAMELPAALDLLRVAVEAGLPVRRALAEVGRHGTGVVADELHAAASCVALGQSPEAALEQLEAHLPLPSVAILTAGIRRSERHGAPLAPTVAALAVEVRSARVIALQERAARVVPRMQLVIALVLVPAVLALVAAVVLARVL